MPDGPVTTGHVENDGVGRTSIFEAGHACGVRGGCRQQSDENSTELVGPYARDELSRDAEERERSPGVADAAPGGHGQRPDPYEPARFHLRGRVESRREIYAHVPGDDYRLHTTPWSLRGAASDGRRQPDRF